MQHYGEKLKSIREKQRVSPAHLAAVLGITPGMLTKRETDGQFPISWLQPLAKAFKMPVSKFVRLSGRKKTADAVEHKKDKPAPAAPKGGVLGKPTKKKKRADKLEAQRVKRIAALEKELAKLTGSAKRKNVAKKLVASLDKVGKGSWAIRAKKAPAPAAVAATPKRRGRPPKKAVVEETEVEDHDDAEREFENRASAGEYSHAPA